MVCLHFYQVQSQLRFVQFDWPDNGRVFLSVLVAACVLCLDTLGHIKDFGSGRGVVNGEEWDSYQEG